MKQDKYCSFHELSRAQNETTKHRTYTTFVPLILCFNFYHGTYDDDDDDAFIAGKTRRHARRKARLRPHQLGNGVEARRRSHGCSGGQLWWWEGTEADKGVAECEFSEQFGAAESGAFAGKYRRGFDHGGCRDVR